MRAYNEDLAPIFSPPKKSVRRSIQGAESPYTQRPVRTDRKPDFYSRATPLLKVTFSDVKAEAPISRNSIVLLKDSAPTKRNFFVYPEPESRPKRRKPRRAVLQSIQSLPDERLPQIRPVYPHLREDPYQSLNLLDQNAARSNRSSLMHKYQSFLQQINAVQVKPPTFELNMRVQRMRVELEKSLAEKRLSSLEARSPFPAHRSSLASSIERQPRVAKEEASKFSDSSQDTIPQFSAYVTREVNGERVLLEEERHRYRVARRFRLGKPGGLEVLLAFEGVLAVRSCRDGRFRLRAGLAEGLRALRQRALVRVVVMVTGGEKVFGEHVKPVLFRDDLKGLIDEIVVL